MARAELLGWGVKLLYNDVTEESLTNAINKVLDDEVYANNVKKISRRLKDQPLPPMETALFWIEYVLRHDGALYMRSSAQYLNFVEYHNLDVYLLLALIVFLTIYIPVYIVKKIYRCCKPKKSQKQKEN